MQGQGLKEYTPDSELPTPAEELRRINPAWDTRRCLNSLSVTAWGYLSSAATQYEKGVIWKFDLPQYKRFWPDVLSEAIEAAEAPALAMRP